MKKLILKIVLGVTFITFIAINMVKGQDQIVFPGNGGTGLEVGGTTTTCECGYRYVYCPSGEDVIRCGKDGDTRTCFASWQDLC